MQTETLVKIKNGCEHRTQEGIRPAGETILVSAAELAAFGDKFIVIASLDLDATPTPTDQDTATAGEPDATPQAQKLAAAMGVNLANVTGTGPNGKITKLDVQQFAGAG